ncbi:hypothetical protein RFI_29373 [Reticulomyxa filosa]|uniref:Uncharacterized protein n=1 Tax=Reticulomyxa filosa TaxID=46433 RepID=X6M3H4_RETFI|nr:hypothetical protein RFI_29373 [Reticulomyxa filosa]|eukprot:ETO08017.1 hypothetical protein RFI_29373 [Reticulomyxa filosa]
MEKVIKFKLSKNLQKNFMISMFSDKSFVIEIDGKMILPSNCFDVPFPQITALSSNKSQFRVSYKVLNNTLFEILSNRNHFFVSDISVDTEFLKLKKKGYSKQKRVFFFLYFVFEEVGMVCFFFVVKKKKQKKKNRICERIINEDGDIRKLVENFILLSDNNEEKKSNEIERVVRSKILLIDEVDVFFNKDFYGNCYSPAATLRHDTITKLIDFIWKDRDSYLKLADVRQSNEYKACLNILKKWSVLLDEAIKDMLNDVQIFESHGYQVSNDKIGYKEQDGISYNIRYGYKTLFAYYYEHAQNRISDESFKNNIFLSFQIGSFSYVEIPNNFHCIMGVSGTLEILSDSEQKVIKEKYGISKYTYMPPLFGDNQLVFAKEEDIFIVSESDYFITLKKEIDDRLVGKTAETKRAVLVFFETKKQLMEFYHSPNFVGIKEMQL